jgi:shikimate kinase
VTAASRIVLVGTMGAGKSTVMRSLCRRLGWDGADTDDLVESAAGETPAQIFATRGEAAFRELEVTALERALSGEVPIVIATGGGIVESAGARDLLKAEECVVLLQVSPEVAVNRISDLRTRPLLANNPLESLQTISDRRRPLYDEVADVVVDVDDLGVDEVVDSILARLEVAS